MSQLGANQFIVLFQVHRNQPVATHHLKLFHRCLLDFTFFRGDNHEVPADALGDIDDGSHTLTLFNGNEIDKVLSLSRAADLWQFIDFELEDTSSICKEEQTIMTVSN